MIGTAARGFHLRTRAGRLRAEAVMVMLMAAQPFAGPAQDGEVSKARGPRLTAHLNIAVSMQGQSRYAGPVRRIRKLDNGFFRFAEIGSASCRERGGQYG